MANTTNKKIREYAKEKNVMLWQIADRLGMQDSNFSKKLRKPLNAEDEKKYLSIIDEIASEKENADAEV